MARYGNQPPIVEDYTVSKQIGFGSFSFVWLARHKHKGHEVAIKEIPTERLNKKLQESLLSEIEILQKINHPNITRLHETKEEQGRIYLVLEYCVGGDLSSYISHHGKVSESKARHFMRQLAAGLRVLREHNLIHRDLKPQNLLLSSCDENAVLKIADFGFARPLQPQGLAETLCGSPLYMAPEIMQSQKYDAKADLWSVGTILYQLVTGKTPFSGSNQLQLMQNILKSNELQFPPDVNIHPYCRDLCRGLLRQNPVERLTFEEFFNHKFLATEKLDAPSKFMRCSDTHSRESSVSGGNPLSDNGDSSQDDCLPFPLDLGNSSLLLKENTLGKNFEFTYHSTSVGNKLPTCTERRQLFPDNKEAGLKFQVSISDQMKQNTTKDNLLSSQAYDHEHGFLSTQFKEVDSLEYIDQEYVFVPAASTELSSSSCLATGPGKLPSKTTGSPRISLQKDATLSVPMSITGPGQLPCHSSVHSGNSAISVDLDTPDQPCDNPRKRLQSLMQSVHVITELTHEKLKESEQLHAFSVQLVCLAIWKQALHVCYNWAASGTEGGSSMDMSACMTEESEFQGAAEACSLIEQKFLEAVQCAERNAPLDGNIEMPDAMEIIFQQALSLGKKGAVAELFGHIEDAVSCYSRAATSLRFLLGEANYLPCNPPFSLSRSDRYRLHRYVDMLATRQSQCTAEGMAVQQCNEDLESI
eukprot:TRINITY_DN3663_c0_g1_i10.p1 TRINITY_DN3663_c0_g1~~TRINITY_DN3663_c0_g1_i10.p1  ORF type:complete len:700 (+),score=152.64 TRINITY_DN3663_c0_g1_i10:691-2790(+)